jgi:hypothetical protein
MNVYALSVNSTNTIFAGTGEGVFRSSDNGAHWVSVNIGLSKTDISALIAYDTNTVFAGTFGNGMFRSSNNGETWSPINSGLLSLNIYAITASSKKRIFIGTKGGVFQLPDNSTTWFPINSGLLSSKVLTIIVDSTETLFAGTYTGGVFKANIGSTSPVSVRTSTPQPASLNISFAPHPVLDRTRLTLDIPRAGMVEVSIFDVLGRLVQHGALGELAAGPHDVEQDLHTLPNGTYSVVVQAGSERVAKLLQVLR